ncbi:DNA polymerase III subunit delta' C-terminal domain-containing protein [Legionella fairfieldensis]|uniref:DNA polymerase III subunit delta' C-terminal domain-containing protein n=1 Tax=Legionella fairfieldensis TaxID=45064 RepID=UPI000685A397|nr:hypothetical protein [Legionella fairfieldensis]
MKSKPAYHLLWERFQTVMAMNRLPHALLLTGPFAEDLLNFSYKIAEELFCPQEKMACGQCKSCRLVQKKEHPDIYLIEPEQSGSIIKIDQIRDLHFIAFTSPQLAKRRIIIIHPAEKMNVAAANALLKLLEEPPVNVLFLLLAEQISTLPATIISRCQQWRFPGGDRLQADYLTTAEGYPAESSKKIFFNHLFEIVQDLMALKTNELSVCRLAQKWSAYDLGNLLWLLYLLTSQMIAYWLSGRHYEKEWTEQVYRLTRHFQPVSLFNQLDQINTINKRVQQNISLNQTLVLENLLLGYKLAPN